jgi:K+-sensing histidine kinase KdpD
MREERAYLQLTIKNSTKGNVLEDNPSFLTNKQEKEFHGLGMQIIQNIVEKYQGTMQFEGEKGWLKINILLLDEGNLE